MTDIEAKTALCLTCRQLIDVADSADDRWLCPICGNMVHQRKKNSMEKTWALTFTALFLYIPANLLPVMTVEMLADNSPNTILGGIIELFNAKMFFIAAVVFVASFVVPLFKICSLLYLLVTMKTRDRLQESAKTKLFHLIEFIGKWSMLDIYVITIMAGLVNMGYLIQIKGGAGATFFAATVIVTMLASKSFDTRLIWDKKSGTDTEPAPL